jgi:YesN/AraC family two-component response regulator
LHLLIELTKQNTLKIDLIFIDLNLPDKSGQDLINEVLLVSKNIPIIVLTGYSHFSFATKSLSTGISDYLLKEDLNASVVYKSLVYSLERNKILYEIKSQNERLKKIAWAQSHLVRAPLARIMNLINFINTEERIDEKITLLEHVNFAAEELDKVIKDLIDDSDYNS